MRYPITDLRLPYLYSVFLTFSYDGITDYAIKFNCLNGLFNAIVQHTVHHATCNIVQKGLLKKCLVL